MPTNIVNMSSGLFADITEAGASPMKVDTVWMEKQAEELRRQQSMATLEALRASSVAAKAAAMAKTRAERSSTSRFLCATDYSEKPDLFKSVRVSLFDCSLFVSTGR